jgi:hypothetical protein
MLGGLLRMALAVAGVLGVGGGALELGLRAAGAGPRSAAELSHVVPDGWTGFRLRPGTSGQEALLTNHPGLHAPRSYALVRPPEALRVAVLGSSVTYGMAMGFADTIPAVVERELLAAGHHAEVLNFGTHAFTIVNLSAQLQAYVHQFQPDVVVAVVDLQVGFPDWPAARLAAASPDEGSERLGWWGTLVRRGSEKSALFALFDEPAGAPLDPAGTGCRSGRSPGAQRSPRRHPSP